MIAWLVDQLFLMIVFTLAHMLLLYFKGAFSFEVLKSVI
jgi:hypothetical protein